jgi:hypothetical protein
LQTVFAGNERAAENTRIGSRGILTHCAASVGQSGTGPIVSQAKNKSGFRIIQILDGFAKW